MRAIVTGGAGFIGTSLTDRLLGEGWEVIIIDDFSTHHGRQPFHMDEGLSLIEARTQDVNPRWHDVKVIFHLAGKVGPVGVLHHTGNIAIDTIESAHAVAGWAQMYGCPLIDISTSEIYGSSDKSNSEDDPKVFPHSASARMEYATAKLAAETMLLNRPVDVRVVRPFNIAGPKQRTEGGFVIPRFVQQALDGHPLTVYLPGTQRRSFTHIDDFIDGVMLVYEEGRKGDIFNLGNPNNECSMMELAEDVISAVGKGTIQVIDPVSLHGTSFKEATDKVPDSERAFALLGWRPEKTRMDIIQETIRYRRDRV